MEAVILIGLQGAGKSTFYRQRFADSHCRISLDQLKTRPRELQMLQSALAEGKDIVVDNTNPTIAERKRYIDVARPAGYRVVGYFFEPDIPGCVRRNAARSGKEQIPPAGLFGTRKRLQPPSASEGFDALFTVRVEPGGGFQVEPYSPQLPLTQSSAA